jgi:hypothetical protein
VLRFTVAKVPDVASLRLICEAVTIPVSMIGWMAVGAVMVAQLKAAGVKRLSTAASLHGVGLDGLEAAAEEIRRPRHVYLRALTGVKPDPHDTACCWVGRALCPTVLDRWQSGRNWK